MTNTRECDQEKCTFHKANGGQMLCPECSECNAESNVIDEDCVNCWNCLKDEGYIRSGLPKMLKEKLKEKLNNDDKKKIIVMNKNENRN